MNIDQTRRLLYDIANTYPLVMRELTEEIGGGMKRGARWAGILAQIPDEADDHLDNVCYEYAHAERELPRHTNDLIFAIREEVLRRHYVDLEAAEQHEKYHRPKAGHVWSSAINNRFAHVAVELGRMVRDKVIERDNEYFERVQITIGLYKLEAIVGESIADEDLPEWLREMVR